MLTRLKEWVFGTPRPPRFPDDIARAQQERGFRMFETHDWDGTVRYDKILEVQTYATGRGHQLVLNGVGKLLERRAFTRSPADCESLFAQLAALDPARFRREIGGSACDTTYTLGLTYFDGIHTHETIYVYGIEPGMGSGRDPRTPEEQRAFALGQMLLPSR